MNPAESYATVSGSTEANKKVNKLLQNIIEEINESTTKSIKSAMESSPPLSGTMKSKNSYMEIQLSEANKQNRDAYTTLGPKLKYKQASRTLNKSSSTKIKLKYLEENFLNQDSSFDNTTCDKPGMKSEAARRILSYSKFNNPEIRTSKSIQPIVAHKEIESICANVYIKGQDTLVKAKEMRRNSNNRLNNQAET